MHSTSRPTPWWRCYRFEGIIVVIDLVVAWFLLRLPRTIRLPRLRHGLREVQHSLLGRRALRSTLRRRLLHRRRCALHRRTSHRLLHLRLCLLDEQLFFILIEHVNVYVFVFVLAIIFDNNRLLSAASSSRRSLCAASSSLANRCSRFTAATTSTGGWSPRLDARNALVIVLGCGIAVNDSSAGVVSPIAVIFGIPVIWLRLELALSLLATVSERCASEIPSVSDSQ